MKRDSLARFIFPFISFWNLLTIICWCRSGCSRIHISHFVRHDPNFWRHYISGPIAVSNKGIYIRFIIILTNLPILYHLELHKFTSNYDTLHWNSLYIFVEIWSTEVLTKSMLFFTKKKQILLIICIEISLKTGVTSTNLPEKPWWIQLL